MCGTSNEQVLIIGLAGLRKPKPEAPINPKLLAECPAPTAKHRAVAVRIWGCAYKSIRAVPAADGERTMARRSQRSR